jgi:hypothetical protein
MVADCANRHSKYSIGEVAKKENRPFPCRPAIVNRTIAPANSMPGELAQQCGASLYILHVVPSGTKRGGTDSRVVETTRRQWRFVRFTF